jgi:hypothetical protein
VYSLGRASEVAETQWLLGAVTRAFARCNEYLLSEYVGEMSLLDLVRDLV